MDSDIRWILWRIQNLKEMNSPNRLPTYRNIWQGCYDVWHCEQDRIDSVEIPKAKMKAAEEGGFIKSEIVKMGKFDQVVYSLTELGEKTLRENNEQGT